MSKNLIDIVCKILKSNDLKKDSLTASELSEIILVQEHSFCEKKRANSKAINNDDELKKQIANEINARFKKLKELNIATTSDRPRKFFYDLPLDDLNDQDATKNDLQQCNNQPEQKLYPILTKYCESMGIRTLRIIEKKSSKGGHNRNKWLHADIVGFKDLTENFNEETKKCMIEYSKSRSLLYSFEVKDGRINPSELREYFFQTVSNSSWANYSYLVAEEVHGDIEEELELLCSSFKIGFIQLNKEEPEQSRIVIQARKTDLDWSMINRIAAVNPDFRKFLNNIILEYKRHSDQNIKQAEWD